MRRSQWLWCVGLLMVLTAGATVPVTAAPIHPGHIFVAYDSSNIGVFASTVSLTGHHVTTIDCITPYSFGASAAVDGGGGVALDEWGNLYVTTSNDGSGKLGIVKVNADGSLAFRRSYERGAGKDLPSSVTDFRSLAIHDGRIYVATNSGVRVFDAATGARLSGADFGGNFAFRDLVFDRQGNLYALRESPTGTAVIHRWGAGNLTGSGTVLFSASGNTDPRALAVDEQGHIYFTANPSGARVVRKYKSDGALLATYNAPITTGVLIGLDYDPGTQRLFVSHTAAGIGQILWVDRNAPSGTTMTAFGPNNLNGVRWLAVYPTPEPTANALVMIGFGIAMVAHQWRVRRRRRQRYIV
ncbi:hypothetical protein HRbin17_01324 [bacterium HR17]|jgi:hypothetical protein|uniref:PEP-CTERM protein-sorting domain-containing protein n=1 Tax=Candidatus Fervidibacter japonicus TaxID=2035412 RepID=A0A2H5XC96_9BACT|nr:hypothetical protein HRbin17_01324 [bacterium HR17]